MSTLRFGDPYGPGIIPGAASANEMPQPDGQATSLEHLAVLWLSRPFAVTTFKNFAAAEKHESHWTLADLAACVQNTTANVKTALPWLKLARFGTAKTDRNSLRHDGNVLAICGVEADYDGEVLTVPEAVKKLTQAGILAMVYTSPSHTPSAPRWRVVCPTSRELPPGQRSNLMGRLNGLFGGIFSSESWTLSQAYYYGSVNRNSAHDVRVIPGRPIDELTVLDETWIGKPATIMTTTRNGNRASGPVDEAALLAGITGGTSYHGSVVRLVGKWAAAGMPLVDARTRLQAAFDAVPSTSRDARWAGRRADIDRCLIDIYGKHADDVDQGRSCAPTEPPALSILDRSACPAPGLPLAVFGPFWGDWITRAAEGANAPPDYVALPLLALASSLLGNARWPVAWRGWAEPPALWCASVGNPSSGKSSGASPVTRDVLAKIETHLRRDYPRDIKDWETVASVAKAVLKQWEKDTTKAIKNKEPVPENPPEATVPPKPIRPRARVVDVTVEKLSAIIEGLPKGVLYVRDELAGWLLNLSRYANGGSDRPFWLESYNGGPMQVDRVKNPDPVFIAHLTVPIFGTIQPERLADVLSGADDGLPSRFIWTWPAARAFAKPVGAADIEAASRRLLRLADLQMATSDEGQSLPSHVHLAEDASEALAAFAREMQAMENTTYGLLKSTIGKARGQVLRLSIVLEYLWWCGDDVELPEPQRISSRAVLAAAGLMNAYFLPMARRVLGDASVPVDERNARTLATWIMETRPERVNVSSIRDGARLPGLRDSDPVKAACRFLVEARWLIEPPSSRGRGRPRGDYIVNPHVWEAGVDPIRPDTRRVAIAL